MRAFSFDEQQLMLCYEMYPSSKNFVHKVIPGFFLAVVCLVGSIAWKHFLCWSLQVRCPY